MKKQLLFIGLALAVSSTTFAQKKNVTDAILLMRKYNPTGDVDANLKTVTDAKNFIDLAAVNPETAEDFKMHLYRAEIYYALKETNDLKALKENYNGPTDANTAKEWKEISMASFKKVIEDPKKTYKTDAENFINIRVEMLVYAMA